MRWYHLCLYSQFLLFFVLPSISAQCPVFEDNGECKLQCQCPNEIGKCLKAKQFCNGVQDCESGFDEENCRDNCGEASLECKDDEFKCLSDCRCYPNSVICDGVKDCSDNTDEIVNDCHLGTPWWLWLIIALVILLALVVFAGIAYMIIKHQKKKDKYVVEGAKPYRRDFSQENTGFAGSTMSHPN